MCSQPSGEASQQAASSPLPLPRSTVVARSENTVFQSTIAVMRFDSPAILNVLYFPFSEAPSIGEAVVDSTIEKLERFDNIFYRGFPWH